MIFRVRTRAPEKFKFIELSFDKRHGDLHTPLILLFLKTRVVLFRVVSRLLKSLSRLLLFDIYISFIVEKPEN